MEEIQSLTDLQAAPIDKKDWKKHLKELQVTNVIFSGWGMPMTTPEFLDSAPQLKALFYGAGSIRGFYHPEIFARNVIVTSSWKANAIPVAEFAFGQIIMALKKAHHWTRWIKKRHCWGNAGGGRFPMAGAFDSTVGLVSLGSIGRHVLRLLQSLDVKVVAYDLGLDPHEARSLGCEAVSLEEVFRLSDVVSLHTALLPETHGFIQEEHLHQMKKNATLINTARGALIDQKALVRVLRKRKDLSAILDVTSPEPPPLWHPLYRMSNVFLTPHIAGSLFDECQRMGQFAVDECRRWMDGNALQHQVTPEMMESMA